MITVEGAKSFWQDAQTYYIEDAANVVNLLDNNQGVSINAPCGVGKSRLLIPNVVRMLNEQGCLVNSEPIDWERYSPTEVFQEYINMNFPDESGASKLLIWDEVNFDPSSDEVDFVRGGIETFATGGIKGIFITPAPTRFMREGRIDCLKKMGKEIGYPIADYALQRAHLPEILVEKYLSKWKLNPEFIKYMVSPEAKPFRHPRTFADLFGLIEIEYTGKNIQNRKLPSSVEGLKGYLSPSKLRYWVESRRGGNYRDLERVLETLGIIDASRENETAYALEEVLATHQEYN